MGRQKSKRKTLTKIHPSLLKPRPQAISQHAADKRTLITTTVNLTSRAPPPLEPLPDVGISDADLQNLIDENLRDDGAEEDISRGYYVARVCNLFPPPPVLKLIVTRTTRSYFGGQSVICSSRNLYDSKAGVYLPAAVVNSAARMARTVALTVFPFSSFVRGA